MGREAQPEGLGDQVIDQALVPARIELDVERTRVGQAGESVLAALLLLTSAWDGNYVAINAYEQSTMHPKDAMPSLDIVAQDDNTAVKIKPVAAIEPGVNVAATIAGLEQCIGWRGGRRRARADLYQCTQQGMESLSWVVSGVSATGCIVTDPWQGPSELHCEPRAAGG